MCGKRASPTPQNKNNVWEEKVLVKGAKFHDISILIFS